MSAFGLNRVNDHLYDVEGLDMQRKSRALESNLYFFSLCLRRRPIVLFLFPMVFLSG